MVPQRKQGNPHLKAAILEVVENQMRDNDPPETRQTYVVDPSSAAIRDGLHDKLLDWMNRTRDPFRGYYWERRP